MVRRDQMPNAPERAQQRHTRDKSIIDRVARNVPKKVPDNKQPKRSPTTSTGLPVEDQVRKEWDPRKAAVSPPSELGSAHDAKRSTSARKRPSNISVHATQSRRSWR